MLTFCMKRKNWLYLLVYNYNLNAYDKKSKMQTTIVVPATLRYPARYQLRFH